MYSFKIPLDSVDELDRVRSELNALAAMMLQCDGLSGQAFEGLTAIINSHHVALDCIAESIEQVDAPEPAAP